MPIPLDNVARWLSQRARISPERLALVDEERRLSFAELEERTQRAAGWLSRQGTGPGDRVALLLANRCAYLELVFAAARLGAIAMPINTRLAPPEVRQRVEDARPAGLVYETHLAGLVDRALEGSAHRPGWRLAVGGRRDAYEAALAGAPRHEAIRAVDPDAPMILMYTSGTTGVPKGALLPHRKTLYNTLNAQLFFGLTMRDRVLVVVPLFHSFGLKILAIPALYAGATVFLRSRFDARELWQSVERERITYFGGVPTLFPPLLEALDAERPDVSSIRFLFTAGAAIPVDLIHAFEARGLRLKQGFGQTETSILCCLDAEDAVRKAGSVGRPVFHAEVRIVRVPSLREAPARWETCEPGEDGEIVVRGPITMLGYWERPEANAETLCDGWLRTGDLARVDEEGFVTLSGRTRELYISGGENVYPRQVEAVLEQHPAVREVAVIGVPHPRWGEVGRAYLVLEPGAALNPEALRTWARERLAAFKVPAEFRAVRELPRTVTGKVQKHRLLDET